MISEDLLMQLVNLSIVIGKNPAYVQGGGGNTSVKIDKNNMYIKASGYELKNVTYLNGFARIDFQLLQEYLKKPDIDMNTFTKKIASFASNELKPSIETGLHASIPSKFVLHSHSVYTNILACSEEGKGLIKNLFPSAIWINYANPGLELIMAFIHTMTNSKDSKMIFLQNHGFIVAGDTAEEVIQLHRSINETIIKYFNLTLFDDYVRQGITPKTDTILFPDQIVYLSDSSIANSTAYVETLKAYDYIYNMIIKNNLTPTFIHSEKISQILNMDAEKYRKNLIRNEKKENF